jgi:two-component system cell cycle response regulator DivK
LSATNSKILYIDDDLSSGSLVKRVLEAEGYTVLLALNGLTGLNQAHRESPDLILLDIYIYMPGLNGHEVARRLRQMEYTKDTPILVISSSVHAEDRSLSAEIGCNGYIPKPIDVDQFSEQIAAFL